MESHLQRLELQGFADRDDDLAVEHAALGELRLERIDQLGEIAIERLLIPALDEDLVAVTEEQRAKAVPLGLEDPAFAGWQLADTLGEHRKDWRIDSEVHRGRRRWRRRLPGPSGVTRDCRADEQVASVDFVYIGAPAIDRQEHISCRFSRVDVSSARDRPEGRR